jgi:hypothetical protein
MRTTHQGWANSPALLAGIGGTIVIGSVLGIVWVSDGFGSMSGYFARSSAPPAAPALPRPSSGFTFTEGRPPGLTVTVEPLGPQHVPLLRGLIVPKEEEQRWAKVPWLTSLVEARKQAAAEGKPILLWDTDGSPLGCT